MGDPPIHARHLLVCREVVYDPLDGETPYSLRGLLTKLRPDDDYGYPWCVEQVYLFAQLYGEPGRYMARIELVPLREDGADARPPVSIYGPVPVRVRDGSFVDGVWFTLARTPFDAPAVYEFRLLLDGYPDPLAAEYILLEP